MVKAKKNDYRAKDIEVLEGLEPVRRRPGMYIGGTEGEGGLHHLIKEILDNSVDEAMNGHANLIEIILHKNQKSITISDNGRGIPVDKHPKLKVPAVEVILTTLHAGGKFSEDNYVSSGGLHGVGASVVNALAEKFSVEIKRDGFTWTQEFSRGKTLSKLKKGKKTKETGTSIYFQPDSEIFKKTEFSISLIESIIEQKAFLNKGLKLLFTDEVNNKKKEYCFKDGISSFVDKIIKSKKLNIVGEQKFDFYKDDGIKVDLSFCWTEGTSDIIYSYVNGIETVEGGSHVDGFKSGLSKALRNYMNVHDLVPKGIKFSGDDFREGAVVVLSVNVPTSITQIQFQGQTKEKLNNPEITPYVDSLLREFENKLNSSPKLAGQIIERISLAARARAAARSAASSVSRKIGISHRLNLPGKLSDCSSNKPANTELFIVEGDSAGGSAKQARDRKVQAILPLRGKIINVISAVKAKVKANKELNDLTSAFGCGSGESINLKKLRYGKIIILTDADSDGMHISALLLAFLYKFMKPLIDEGHVYLGMPPLYRIKHGTGPKQKIYWVYTDEEKDAQLKKIKSQNVVITRFKGLGEMSPKVLWDTTMNPKTRTLLQIKVEDIRLAEEMLIKLLGKDSSGRYQLIQDNAHRLALDL